MKAKEIDWTSCINEEKIKRDYDLYIEAKNALENIMCDNDIKKNYIDSIIEKGIIIRENMNAECYSEDGSYSAMFAMYIWRNVYMEAMKTKYDFGYDSYRAIETLL